MSTPLDSDRFNTILEWFAFGAAILLMGALFFGLIGLIVLVIVGLT